MMLRGLLALGIALLLRPAGAKADAVEDFYKSRPVTLVIGNGPGGGFDAMGRLLARHIYRFIPGVPTVVVQNMPGAGSLVAANYLYGVAPKDGSVFGLFARNIPLIGLLGDNPSVRFDPRKFTWLGSSSDFSSDAYVLIVKKGGPVRSVADAIRPGGPTLMLGGTAQGGGSSDVPRILHDTLGLRMQMISGYRDSAAIYLAMENGEVTGRMNELSSLRTSKPDWLKPDSPYEILLQYARATPHPSYPHAPTARELAPSPAARALIELTESPFTMAWPYAAPPGIPSGRAAALQAAFEAAHRDPQFLADAKRVGADVNLVTAAQLGERIEALSRSSPDQLGYVRKLLVTGADR